MIGIVKEKFEYNWKRIRKGWRQNKENMKNGLKTFQQEAKSMKKNEKVWRKY